MQIIISGRHFEVTDSLRVHISERIESLFAHYPTLKVSSVRVIMDILKNRDGKVEIMANLKHRYFVAFDTDSDLHRAIDTAAGHLGTQLDRYVDRYKRPVKTPPIRTLGEPVMEEEAIA